MTASERGKVWRAKNKARAKLSKKKWDAENREKIREHEKNRWAREKANPASYHKPDEEKYKARMIVNNAIATGKLPKPATCSQCKKSGARIHAHHLDYKVPLNVVWVCPPCHRVFHA